MRSILRYVLVGAALFGAAFFVEKASAETTTEIIYQEAARYGVSGDWLYRVALCESTLNPYAIGRAGEVGLFQFHPRGIWQDIPIFRTWGDVYDIRLNARAAAWAFSRGLSFHWSCA